jgi:hypothetical protein
MLAMAKGEIQVEEPCSTVKTDNENTITTKHYDYIVEPESRTKAVAYFRKAGWLDVCGWRSTTRAQIGCSYAALPH